MPISFDDVELSTPTAALAPNWEALRVERARAVRVVASAALDANDCAQLLDALGLCAKEARLPDRGRGR